MDIAGPSLIAISPDSYSIAVSVNNHLMFFDGLTGKQDELVENICNGKIRSIFNIFTSVLKFTPNKQVIIHSKKTVSMRYASATITSILLLLVIVK